MTSKSLHRAILLQNSLVTAIILQTSLLSTAPANAADLPQEQLERLLKKANDARRDAEDALRRAKEAEAEVARLLTGEPIPHTSADAARFDLPSVEAGQPARMDCIRGQVSCDGVTPGYDLLAYPYRNDEKKDRNKWAETRLVDFLKKQDGRKVSFANIDQPFVSRFSVAKGDEAMDAQYALPLSRRRILLDSSARVVTSSLALGVSASFDPDNKKVGLIARGGSFADDQIAVSLTFGRQFYPSMPIHGDKGSADANAKSFANALIDRCEKALAAKQDHFGNMPLKPAGCEGTALLAWSFDPNDAERYKANVAAYNQAFWEPSDNAIPEVGFGVTATLGTKVFKYIVPSAFTPGIVVDPLMPNLLSTLLAKSKDGSKPDLGQLEVRRYSPSLGAYAFRRFEGRVWLFDGLLVRPSATVARRWEIKEAFTDKEYCALKVGTIGECKKFNVAEPEANWSFEPSLNFRTQIDPLGVIGGSSSRYFAKVGISPTITYNSHKDSYRLVVPAYVAADKDGKLTGGVQFARDWGNANPEKNESVWSVFLSTAFSMDGSKN